MKLLSWRNIDENCWILNFIYPISLSVSPFFFFFFNDTKPLVFLFFLVCRLCEMSLLLYLRFYFEADAYPIGT